MGHDAIIVGAGTAGLAAATWLGRHRRTTLVLDSGEPRNRWVRNVHGYLGFDPVDPSVLRQRALDSLQVYDTVTVRPARVRAVGSGSRGFEVDTGEERLVAARLIIATGVEDVFPDVDRFFDYYGTSVFHCPTCDGYDVRGSRVIVFGWDAEVAGFALGLLDWAAEVTVVTDGRRFQGDERHRAGLAAHGVQVIEAVAVALEGGASLEAVRLEDGTTLPCGFAFFSIRHRPQSGFGAALGCLLDEEGYLVVDEHGQTTVHGVYAAGDVTPGLQLVQTAAASGAAAGVYCALSLRDVPDIKV
jgi:thioredoxin reductase